MKKLMILSFITAGLISTTIIAKTLPGAAGKTVGGAVGAGVGAGAGSGH